MTSFVVIFKFKCDDGQRTTAIFYYNLYQYSIIAYFYLGMFFKSKNLKYFFKFLNILSKLFFLSNIVNIIFLSFHKCS